MVEGGYADVRKNPRDKLYYGLLLERREEAMRLKKGLWSHCANSLGTPSEHAQTDMKAPSAKCSIKGNISEDEFGKTYFTRECNNYAQVKVDPSRGEKYFCSEGEAKKAGFMKARYCP